MNDTLRRLLERPWYLPILLLLCGDSALQAQTSVTFTVSANTDDADEHSGTVYVTDSYSLMSGYVGFRFQNVTIPAGATVTSATLDLYAYGSGTSSFSVDLTAEDGDNPSTFSTSANNISSRTLTTAQTLWSLSSYTFTDGVAFTSPDFASTIQEVIDRAGWSSGNSLVVITTPNSGDKGIWKYSGNTSYAPQLHITYTTTPDPAGTVLMVTAGSSLTSEESARQTQFESWGYTVNTIEDGDSQANFDTAMAAADVVYVPQSVDVASLGYKLRTASIGVVHEGISSLDDNVGWTTSTGYNANTSQTMTITDNTHPVTDGLSTGTITIYTSSTGSYGAQINGTLASGAQQLGTNLGINSGLPSLVVFDKDATLANTYDSNSTASGRRVHLPFGGFGTFSWSNLTSDSLTMIRNSLDWASIVPNGRTVLFVRDDSSSYLADEQDRVDQFEAWGYSVTPIWESESQSTFDTALLAADVVYICEEVSSANVAYKLRESTVGVVYEENQLDDEFGLSDSGGTVTTVSAVDIVDSSHYITDSFSAGSLTTTTSGQPLGVIQGTLGGGVQVLGQASSSNVLAVVDRGGALATTYNSSSAAFGRRARLPWSGTSFSWSSLNSDGLLITLKALEWASNYDGLVGHWKLDETSGTTAADSSGLGNDGTLIGSPTWELDAVYGGGLTLDYTDGNDYVEIPNSTALDNLQLGSYTLAAWFMPFSVPPATGNDNLSGYGLIKKPTSSLGIHYSHIEGFQVNHYADEGSGPVQQAITASVYTPNKWHHVAMTVDQGAGVVTLYVNGQAVGTNTFPAGAAGMDTTTQQWRLGISNPGGANSERPAHGVMDDARIYSRSLSAAEVAELYGLLGHWKLDETSGTTAADSSGVGNDGTYTNGPVLGGSGVYGNAADFDGVDDHVAVNAGEDLNLEENVSVSCWAKSDTATWSGWGSLVSKRNQFYIHPSFGGTYIYFAGDTIGAGDTSAGIDMTTIGSIQQWHHYVGVYDYDEGEVRFYVDGTLRATTSLTAGTSLQSDTGALTIGWDDGIGGTRYHDGQIDDVRLYNRAISEKEITELYGLVGHWKLDESSGTVATDSSGISNDGNYWNGSAPGANGPYPGEGANAAEFDGGSAHVGVYSVDTYDNITETITVAAWVKFNTDVADQTSQEFVLGRENYGSNLGFNLFTDQPYGDRLSFRIHDGSTNGTANYNNPGFRAGEWHHVVGTYDGTTIHIYVDGELKATQTYNSGTIAQRVGDNLNMGWQLDGNLFDVRLYSRAISHQEVAELYGLTGYWKFDEGSGITIADSTAFGNDASFSTGTPAWVSGAYGNALEFDGTNDAITGGNFDPAERGAVSFWMRSDGTPASRQRPWGLGADFEVWQDTDGLLSFDVATDGYQGGFITDERVDDEGRWYHFVGQYDSDTDSYEIYINGELHKSGVSTWNIQKQAASLLSFGTRTGNTQRFDGALDDFRIYNRWLSVAEINELYGRLAYWKFDETSGSTAVDSTERGNDADFVSSPTLGQPGAHVPETNMAMQLDGSTQYADTNTSLVSDLSAFTLTGWLRPDGFMEQQSYFGQNDAIEFGVSAGNQIQLWTPGGGLVNVSTVIPPSKWSHVTATGDGTNVRVYVDGIEVASGGYSTSNYGSSSYGFRIGEGVWGGTGDYFDGRIDDVQVFNRALTPEEIFPLYRGGRPTGVRIIQWVETR